MGGFGGGSDSSGSSNRERAAQRNRIQKKTTTKKTATKKTISTDSNQREEAAADNRKSILSRANTLKNIKNKENTFDENSINKFKNSIVPDNKLYKFIPPYAKGAINLLNKITDAPKKNLAFFIDNYDRIGTNIELPSKREFSKMDLEQQQKIYSNTRTTFQQNNLDPLGESLGGGGGSKKLAGINLADSASGSATVKLPSEIQKEASNNPTNMTPANTTMSAAQVLLNNKRKGRRSTNITAKKTLSNNYTLSEKTLLG